MPTIQKLADREALLARLRKLQPTSERKWGKLDAPRMVSHLADALRVSVGEATAKRTDTFLSRTLVKWIVVNSPLSPPPGKIETAPEFLASAPGEWSTDITTVERLIVQLAKTPTNAVHPYFGPLSHEGWGRLTWKHVDHHLRQFGC